MSRVGLFVTCLVDLFRPSVGFAAVKLLEDAGCSVAVPSVQTCCGQPAYNSGDRTAAQHIARQVIDAFSEFDHVVAPSGSCAGMLARHYPDLLKDDAVYASRARAIADKTRELVSFLTDGRGVTEVKARYQGAVAYHDSCAALRECDVKAQPRALLSTVAGIELREVETPEACCGFGGTFCVKYPDVSDRMVSDKVDDIVATGADTVVSGDLGCLLNIAGKLSRGGSPIAVRHVAELLAGMGARPGIGQPAIEQPAIAQPAKRG